MKKENMTLDQKLEVIENAVIDWKKRLDTIRENISAFSDYLDETNQMGAIDDKAWDYLVNIEKAVGGIWPEDNTKK
jgi:DNA-binding ferritin-like protein (Dps family)